ncbi:MAG: hypothetical protein WCK76_10430 [Elusimicrobiota bacterium]
MKKLILAVIAAALPGLSAAADFADLQRLDARQVMAAETVPASRPIQIANPDDPALTAPCAETLRPGAPYDAAGFKAALDKALKSRALDAEALGDFFFKDDIPAILAGKFGVEGLYLNDCALTAAISKSMEKPVNFFMISGGGHSSYGGMVLYRGDIFAEGFYRNRQGGVEVSYAARRKYNNKELMTRQPWFEWDPAAKAFRPHAGGASQRIARHAAAAQGSADYLWLYRGTNEKYSYPENALPTVNTFAFDGLGAVFTTPDYGAAKNWAGPVVLSSRIPLAGLAAATGQDDPGIGGIPRLYVGMEFDYVEAAFAYKAGEKNNLFIDNLQGRCRVEGKGDAPSVAEVCR